MKFKDYEKQYGEVGIKTEERKIKWNFRAICEMLDDLSEKTEGLQEQINDLSQEIDIIKYKNEGLEESIDDLNLKYILLTEGEKVDIEKLELDK